MGIERPVNLLYRNYYISVVCQNINGYKTTFKLNMAMSDLETRRSKQVTTVTGQAQ